MLRKQNISWNLPAPPGFRGLDSHVPIARYGRHLPHWRQSGATYFVTFRLGDSLPQSKLRELEGLKREWQRKHPPPWSDLLWRQYAAQIGEHVDEWLDQGIGSCVLRKPVAQREVSGALHYFDEQRYELGCYIVMPNHVHAIVRPFDDHPLERILQSWKRHSARQVNTLLGQAGELWQDESYDQIVRDEAHLYHCVQYIGSNAGRANLEPSDSVRWIRPHWESAGWMFEV